MANLNNEPLVAITLKLAELLDPEACGQFESSTFDARNIVDPRQVQAIEAAKAVVLSICLVVEQEYAVFYGRGHAGHA